MRNGPHILAPRPLAPLRSILPLRWDEKATLALLAGTALLRVALIFLGWPHLNSDEAVVGLMARHIVSQGERPLFIWGVHYEGPFEAYIAAPFFAVFGSSTVLLHLSNQTLIVAFLVVMYVLARAVFGRFVGLLAALWLGFGSTFALHREIITVGGYQEALLLSALLLLLAWTRLRRAEALPHNRRAWWWSMATYAGIGCCIGLGVWSSLLIVPLALLTLIALVVCRWRELLRGGVVAMAAAAVLSALPYLSYQLSRQFPALAETRRISHPTLAPPALAHQTLATLSVGLPTLLGSPVICPASRTSTPPAVCTGANALFSLGVLALFGAVAVGCALGVWSVLRRGVRPTLHAIAALGGDRAPEMAERQARWWVRVVLLGVVAATLAAYLPTPDAAAHPQSSARYLLPILLAVPLVIDLLARHAAPALRDALRTRRSIGSQATKPALARAVIAGWKPSARLATIGVTLVVALALVNVALTLGDALRPNGAGLPPARDRALMSFLQSRHVSAFYADYWTCYRLAFEANERIRCAVRGQNGDPGLELINNHYPPYIQELARQSYPAYILPAGTATDTNFAQEAATEHLPYQSYQRAVIAGYAVYYYPSSA